MVTGNFPRIEIFDRLLELIPKSILRWKKIYVDIFIIRVWEKKSIIFSKTTETVAVIIKLAETLIV